MSAAAAIVATVTVGAFAAGIAAIVWRAGAGWLRESPVLVRRNWAGRPVPASGGIVVAVASIAALSASAILAPEFVPDGEDWVTGAALPMLALAAGFALLGVIDDVLGDDVDKGFVGHLRALLHGRVTTGMCKLAGGAAIAVVVASSIDRGWGVGRIPMILLQAAVIALCANLANLLDRSPGRLAKASVVTGVPLLAVALMPSVATAGAAVAAAAPLCATWTLLPADLKERCMLGDAGANVVGAVIGWLVVSVLGTTGLVVALVAVLAANALSEFVSYSRIIEAIAPLRTFDRWGRLPHTDDTGG